MPARDLVRYIITAAICAQSLQVNGASDDDFLDHGCGKGTISLLDFSRMYPNVKDNDKVMAYGGKIAECRPCQPGAIETTKTFPWWSGAATFDLNECRWCPDGKIANSLQTACVDPVRSRGSTESSYILNTLSPIDNSKDNIVDLVGGHSLPSDTEGPKHAKKPLKYTIMSEIGDVEKHAYDSVIAAYDSTTLDCGTGQCNFNEMFICSNLDRWHSFQASSQTTRWFRNVQDDSWKVEYWKYIQTTNFIVEVVLRGGDWGNTCEQPVGITWEKKLKSNDWGPIGNSKLLQRYYVSDRPITCMLLQLPQQVGELWATCDTRYKTEGDWKFETTRNVSAPLEFQYSVAVALPSNITRSIDSANALSITRPIGLRVDNKITSCKPGYKEFHKEAGWINRCVDINSFPGCNIGGEGPGSRIVSSCANERIAESCASYSFDDEFEDCFRNEVKKCQDMKYLPDPPRLDFQCRAWINYCEDNDEPQGPRFYSLTHKKCLPCYPSPIDGLATSAPPEGMALELGFECKGAYGGRLKCVKRDEYMLLREEDSFEKATETIYSTGTLLVDRTLNAYCAPCSVGARPNFYADPTIDCEDSWKRRNVQGEYSFYLHSSALSYKKCENSNCELGEFARCPDGACRPCACESTCSKVVDNDEQNYCLIDVDSCNGYGFLSTGASCMVVDDFKSCPIGHALSNSHYNQGESGVYRDSTFRTFTSNLPGDLADALCLKCQHPGLIYDDNRFCEDGKFWPGCNSPGLTRVPPCENCPEKPTNSEWVQRSQDDTFPECKWECSENFHLQNNSCVSCTLNPCGIGTFRQFCARGTVEIPSCRACSWTGQMGLTGCGKGYHKRNCNGNGYGTDGDAETKTTCALCRTTDEMNCPLDTTFEACNTGSSYDTSACIPCPQNDNSTELNLEGVLYYTKVCEFVCKAGYYREATSIRKVGVPEKTAYKCVLCSNDPYEYCKKSCKTETNCRETYEVTQCTENNTIAAPTCLCKPGYGMSDRGNEGISCTKCNNFLVSNGRELCYHCRGGYSGPTKNASAACEVCPVNTFRPYTNDKSLILNLRGCETCAAGTNGFTGSKTCITTCSNGLMAIVQDWDGYLWNYINSTWTYWSGFPPTVCTVKGMGPDLKICNQPGQIEDIKYRKNPMSLTEFDVYSIDPTYECGQCGDGLAFTSNFNYNTAVEGTREL